MIDPMIAKAAGQRVLALDPGERVGWARAYLPYGPPQDVAHGVMPLKACALRLQEVATNYDVIVYETWRPRPVNGSMNWIQGNDLQPAQFVGMLRLCGWVAGAQLYGQGPDRKRPGLAFATELGWMDKDFAEQHDQDALMHLALYWSKNWRPT